MNHYKWLDKNFLTFLRNLNINEDYSGLIEAHADKVYGYRDLWKDEGIPFNHGAAIYLLSYIPPYSKEINKDDGTWIAPNKWVIENYNRFRKFLPRYLNIIVK